MSPLHALRGWRGPPLALQILGLLVGGLIVAQLVTLFLTMVLPPAPAPQYGLADITAALRGEARDRPGAHGLERALQKGPPDASGRGWLVSDRSRRDLAGLLGADPRDVTLAFYTPLPFAGALASDARLPGARLGFADPPGALLPASYVMPADGGPPSGAGPPGGFPSGGFPSGGFPSGGFPGVAPADPRAGGPGTGVGRARPSPAPGGAGAPGRAAPADGDRALSFPAPAQPIGVREGGRSATDGGSPTFRPYGGGIAAPPFGQAGPPSPVGARGGGPALAQPAGRGAPYVPGIGLLPGNPIGDVPPMVRRMPDEAVATAEPAPATGEARRTPAQAEPVHPPQSTAEPVPVPAPAPAERRAADVPAYDAPVPVPLRAPERGLFGIAPAPFVEGDFVAAWRLPDGHWAVVQPVAEPFPNAWQRRLMLWFAVAFAIVGPLGWLFARRLVKPLSGFAAAAEQLGRDPGAAVLPLRGPAEIGRAANAFNLMQSRLRAFVDDRTAMVGAISHDLRTPLTRMRFRIEEVDDHAARAGMIGEVEEMEAMITSVLDYIRDASTPGVRERLDLRLLVDDVVDDALLIGSDVRVERAEPAPVEVDVLGMRRVLDNLLENAVKYGQRARVRLLTDADDAIAEIIDDGPGLPDDELERVFEPFYRGEEARASDKRGSGLGLAVCRSIARAHGGDVRLVRSTEGFLAQVRVPLAYGTERQAA